MFLECDQGGPLIRGFRKDGEIGITAELAVTDAGSCSDKTGQAGQLLSAPKRLDVFVENLVGRKLTRPGGRRYDIVVLSGWTGVQIIERDRSHWDFADVMTGITRDPLYSREVPLINVG